MADLLTPQFKLPFRVVNGGVDCVEQDSVDDVYQNAVVVMRYRQGDRSALPDFGIPDPTFSEGRTRTQEVMAAVRTWEPDAEVEMVHDIITNEGTHTIEVAVSPEDSVDG